MRTSRKWTFVIGSAVQSEQLDAQIAQPELSRTRRDFCNIHTLRFDEVFCVAQRHHVLHDSDSALTRADDPASDHRRLCAHYRHEDYHSRTFNEEYSNGHYLFYSL